MTILQVDHYNFYSSENSRPSAFSSSLFYLLSSLAFVLVSKSKRFDILTYLQFFVNYAYLIKNDAVARLIKPKNIKEKYPISHFRTTSPRITARNAVQSRNIFGGRPRNHLTSDFTQRIPRSGEPNIGQKRYPNQEIMFSYVTDELSSLSIGSTNLSTLDQNQTRNVFSSSLF